MISADYLKGQLAVGNKAGVSDGPTSDVLVLVVDDDEVMRFAMVTYLKANSYRVVEAENGVCALEEFDRQTPDIVLIDAMMPVMDGFTLCREIKKRPEASDVQLVIVTVMDDESSIISGYDAGADEYIAKPINWPLLTHRVRKLLERRDADVALRESELSWRSITENCPDHILALDLDLNVVHVNRALPGMSVEELIGTPWHSYAPAGQAERIRKTLENVLKRGESTTYETVYDTPDGEPIVYESRVTQRIMSHKVVGLSLNARDITERQKLQKQLQQAQKMEAIGQLTGGIAHDFNNMLSAVLGYTELAAEEVSQHDNKELVEYLGEVYKAGSRARDLVAQMLAFSRGGEGKLEAHELSLLITESLKMLGTTLPSSIEMDLHLDNEFTVMTNPVQIHQLVMNLCINARDAMKGKGHISIGLDRVNDVKIECSSCHERVVGNYIQLFVRDTGPGIQPEQLDRIFDPFYSTKEVGKGTGMGLSMVHGIMHDHGGHIVVTTEKDGGASFTLLFPVTDIQADTVIIEDTDTKTSLNQTFDGNILIVDDEVSVGRFIGELLKGCGCQVTVETDSRSALLKFEKNPGAFDLVVTDQTMPGMTGAELALSLLAIRSDLPIILCTGYSDQVDEAGAEAIGISGYVSKPIETDVFLGLVGKLLQPGKISSENPPTI